MMSRWIGGLLIAATALTPIAAQAQSSGFGSRVQRDASNAARESNRAPRVDRSSAPRATPANRPARAANAAPRVNRAERRDTPRQVQRGDSQRNWNQRRATQPQQQRTGNDRRVTQQQRNWNERRNNRDYRNNDGFGQRVVRDSQRAANQDRRYDNRRDNRYDNRRDNRYDNRRNNRYDNNRRWNTSWRNDRRYDWRSHRTRYSNNYRLGRYHVPYNNWSYRRLSIGFSLWPLFYSNQYWINDPWQYRLPDVYGPYRWVRYYDDALLVDIHSGEVVDVIYDFFW